MAILRSDISSGASILRKYFPTVKPLDSYIEELLGEAALNNLLLREQDPESLATLLNSAYVGVKADVPRRTFKAYAPMSDMAEVLKHAQERLLQPGKRSIITIGYSYQYGSGSNNGKWNQRKSVTNYFINTIITIFCGPEWETLLQRVGEDVMVHLLTETSIFVALPNGCYCQVTGEPLIHLPPSAQDLVLDQSQKIQVEEETKPDAGLGKKRRLVVTESEEGQGPSKKRKLETVPAQTTSRKVTVQTKKTSPADISFARIRLFYSRPSYVPHSNKILVSLPLNHILNRLHPAFGTKGPDKQKKYIEPNDEKTRHLSKYIFARQYGLPTPFSSPAGKAYAYKMSDFVDREVDIKALGPTKTPKRLKDIHVLLEKILRGHARCGYLPLRDIACPSKVKTTGHKDLDTSIILELMSETSVQLRSQKSMTASMLIDSSGNSILPFGGTQAREHVKNKPRFVEFSCPHIEVYRYVALITNAVIPEAFWGSKRNLKVALQYVKQFISCRRHETLSLHHILQQFSTSDCDWLIPPGKGTLEQGRVSVTDSLKRRELLEDFLFWYFDSFVLPLLKTTFYVTDSSAFRNNVLYFRHDDWDVLCAPLIERLTSVTFAKLSDAEATEILRQRQLGYSFVRLLPKETGVRPIVNLKRKKASAKGSYSTEQSINQILQGAFSILTYEKTHQPELLGVSLFSPDDMYLKLKKLKASLPRDANGNLPKLYFVKLDVQACFDTIDQTKLLHILRQIISEDTYMIQRYGQVSFSLDRVKRSYVKKAVPQDDHPHFLRYAADLAEVLRNTIFVDQVYYPEAKRQDVLQLLEEHITENIVKIGQHYYRQMIGIPQGSVLSSILCSFFYGDLEKKLARFMNNDHSMLLRLIDDYLFVTTSHSEATDFLSTMKKGHPEYGCFISEEKTLTNFEHGDTNGNIVDQSQQTFPWCGYSIGMKDLSVTVDYTRYHGSGLQSTLTIERGRRPGAAFGYKLMQLAKAKKHPIYSDRELNSEHTVYLNIYQNLLLTAMKMHEYIRDWGTQRKVNLVFLRNTIQKTILYAYTSSRAPVRYRGENDGRRTAEKEAVIWLGNHAFHHVLNRKSSKFPSLAAALSLELRKPKLRRYARQFVGLVKVGQAGLAGITS